MANMFANRFATAEERVAARVEPLRRSRVSAFGGNPPPVPWLSLLVFLAVGTALIVATRWFPMLIWVSRAWLLGWVVVGIVKARRRR